MMIKVLSFLIPICLILSSFLVKKRQNKGDIVGGDISTPKSLWLVFAIGAWFFYPFLFYLTELNNDLKMVLNFHLISIWLRGIIELVMIYKLFNWSPRYGIAHNTFHFLGVLILFLMSIKTFQINAFSIFILLILVSFIFENLFAYLFFKVRGEEKHKVYFANDGPEWTFINKVTIFGNTICYGLLFLTSYNLNI